MIDAKNGDGLYILHSAEQNAAEEDFLQGSIMRTKLYRPPMVRDAICRDHLLKQPWDSRRTLLTLIQASAGYGKSVLASSFAASLDEPNAWLSLDEGDNHLRRFLLHFIAAVRSMFPGSCRAALNLLKALDLPPKEVLTQQVINDLDRLDGGYTLFLDDYHSIENPEVHDLLNQIFRHPPRGLHFVMTTRFQPPLSLNLLRARGEIWEITERRLRFTLKETSRFLQEGAGVSLDEEALELIDEKIEGWAAGLRLLAVSLQDRSDLNTFLYGLSGDSGHIAEYLTAELSARQSPVFERYLLLSAVSERFSASLCEALRDRADSDKMEPSDPAPRGADFIAHLKSSGMLVVPLDHENRWFRYHYMVRQLLQRQLEDRIGPEERRRLHSRAAQWFVDNNLIDEAIRHALLAGEIENVLRLVEKHRQDALTKDEWYSLKEWIEEIPDTAFVSRPGLLMARAWVYFHQFRLAEIPPILDVVDALLKDDMSDSPIRGEVAFLRGFFLNFCNRSEEATAHFNEARRLIPLSYDYARGMIELYSGVARHMNGDGTVFLEFRQLLLESPAVKDIFRSRIHAGMVYIPLLQGSLHLALQSVDALDVVASRMKSPYAQLWSVYLRGNIALMRNDPAEAARCFTEVFENRYQMFKRTVVDAMAGLALAYQLLGSPEKADETALQLRSFVTRSFTPANALPVHSCRARLSILRGNAAPACDWADSVDLSAEVGFMIFWIESPRLTQCRAWIAARTSLSLRRAEHALAKTLEECRRTHNTYQTIQILTLQSALYCALGERERARTTFLEAAQLAAPSGFILPFLELGDCVFELLDILKTDPSVADRCDNIRVAFEAMPGRFGTSLPAFAAGAAFEPVNEPEMSIENPSAYAQVESAPPLQHPPSADRSEGSEGPRPIEPLTSRETEILRFLTEGLQNKEISERLFVSVETVKKHLYNMYQKLEVHSRGELVAKFIRGLRPGPPTS